jgi:hypothetical protein
MEILISAILLIHFFGLGRNEPNGLDENRGQDMAFTFTNTLNYIKTFNDLHNVNLLLENESISVNPLCNWR